ncbi:MAG: ATP-dependent Clp protease proteolytic subunit [Treponema sp.]|nr:ATP-dependent Clp protease proteolytic subunit [Treponema sp.]
MFKLDSSSNEKKEDKSIESISEKFLETRQIILSGEINKDLADKIVRQLLIIEASSKEDPITLFIDSPGGDVDAGFAIYDMINFISCPVKIVGMGLIASAATLVLLSVPKESRFGLPNSHYLIHQPMSGMKGVATDIEIHAMEMAKTKEKINSIISLKTGTSQEKVAADTERDYWLSAEESVKYGLISKIITNRNEL